MLSKRSGLIALTALAPALWGTTYLTATALLPPGHPLLTATLRALPAGLVLLVLARRLPTGAWWGKAVVLGTLNITVFFFCLFVAAERLPGGIAAVVGGVQPLLVAVIAAAVLADRLSPVVVGAGLAGALGVALIVLRADAALDPVGVVAAVVGAASMATGTVLTKKWGGGLPPLATTAWQLVAGGLSLAVLTALLEPLPTTPITAPTVVGYAYLSLVGTALAYLVWFRGVASLPVRVPAFLGLLSPIVALALGAAVAGETLSALQVGGIALILGSVAVVILAARGSRPWPRPPRLAS
ncbi:MULTISPECIES: EamA family transporter [unclassified Microbacterium]|uniref:EamA family transporter n=1 Tax=unclassified Microbacterium TaxID=2609290 RepID=UPI0038701CB8